MSDAKDQDVSGLDPQKVAENWQLIGERTKSLITEFLARNPSGLSKEEIDPLNVSGLFMDVTARMLSDPNRLVEGQLALWKDYMQLWQHTTARMMGQESEPLIAPEKGDKRFRDEAWEENDIFDFIKQSYLLTSRYIQNTVHEVEDLDEHTQSRADFYAKQFVDAIAPTNFLLTNPQVLRATLESGGDNLVKGLENVLEDLDRGNGRLAIRQTDLDAFEVGRNIATTPGKVVFQNELLQLIQYTPTTEEVYERPLLIVPPWINKFYILDLKPENSFIKWAVDQGISVFVVSWVNPDSAMAKLTFEDYLETGIMQAIDAVCDQCSIDELNMIGYCIGGTLTAAGLAYMAAKGDKRVKAATFFTTLVDFEKAGDLKVFVDDAQIEAVEKRMESKGYLSAQDMQTTFNMLRSNDLIWSYVVNNYMLGKDPFPFDLLYWNQDSTRMPRAMHLFYLKNMYRDNLLSQQGGIELLGTPIDLHKVNIPVYIQSSKEDHIAPFPGVYKATQLYSGDVTFMLAASGHIAGVINPPAANKYCYWTNDELPPSHEEWLATATQHDGSWWPHWLEWYAEQGGEKVPARDPEKGKLKPIEDAPGSYVLIKAT